MISPVAIAGLYRLNGLSQAQLLGRAALPETVPLTSRLRSAFEQRIDRLPTSPKVMRMALTPRLRRDLACAIAGRELTRREWDEVLADRPYREVCAPA